MDWDHTVPICTLRCLRLLGQLSNESVHPQHPTGGPVSPQAVPPGHHRLVTDPPQLPFVVAIPVAKPVKDHANGRSDEFSKQVQIRLVIILCDDIQQAHVAHLHALRSQIVQIAEQPLGERFRVGVAGSRRTRDQLVLVRQIRHDRVRSTGSKHCCCRAKRPPHRHLTPAAPEPLRIRRPRPQGPLQIVPVGHQKRHSVHTASTMSSAASLLPLLPPVALLRSPCGGAGAVVVGLRWRRRVDRTLRGGRLWLRVGEQS
mmetsp:Transcript_8367/g.20704  ORF Transcript_8367/g.20704 Transcript_8367/m.20704 type:complete len:258 (-) Transcript_8367:783-1556(-)